MSPSDRTSARSEELGRRGSRSIALAVVQRYQNFSNRLIEAPDRHEITRADIVRNNINDRSVPLSRPLPSEFAARATNGCFEKSELRLQEPVEGPERADHVLTGTKGGKRTFKACLDL